MEGLRAAIGEAFAGVHVGGIAVALGAVDGIEDDLGRAVAGFAVTVQVDSPRCLGHGVRGPAGTEDAA